MTALMLMALAVSIGLGYKTKINIGFFTIAFAYLIGCFGMGLKPSEVIELWPVKIFFIILSVTLFYNFALANGALEKLASHLLYKCRKFPQFLPLAIFFAATIIAGLGAGFYTVLAFMAPITLLLCKKTNMNMIIGGMAANYGALAGANFMTSQSGIIFRSLMENTGISSQTAFSYSSGIFVLTLIIPIAVLGIYTLWNRKSNSIVIEDQKPEPFDKKQKQSIFLIILMMSIVLVFPILHLVFPDVKTISFLNSKIDIAFLAITFSLISLLMKLADEKKVIALVPWGTLIMICGVGMLIALGVKLGIITTLSEWLANNVPVWVIPVLLCLISAIMSVFSSTLGVVAPTLFPIVPALALTSGLNPLVLFICIVVGAQSTAISPFSSGGSLIMASAPADIDKTKFFNQLLFKAIPVGVIAALIAIFALKFVM
ncbi:SLC13 family permease [Acinetobacter baumannii]|jgi:di/tricarboxylate transporter|uniref:Dicarboxylate carrier MatC N-terminal domain-containing protein n=13 Tax=Acinetobacter TaxID=469 RepID=A0ABX6CJ97_ACIB2|nr:MULTISPECIES: SLC13 family permease [Acinetobacter]EMT96537.1 Dicarboxylate carrier protein MatC N-terminus family protein [Acinetobacter baumannii ABNIH6]EYD50786.1 citrate transporter family protein [Acinetobacter baumannii 25493_4]EYS13010.1 citrate transporter family protein [Acinetobacter baumannii 25569_7]ACJ41507.1 C4-dicarboxylate ABC transporter [Acinetobacter baumannii AB0057]AHB91298.1 dicarboxylate carrier protein MatC family protein [Acinetobacter baumannii ZW85-1]